jgi:hypothetical protein
VPDGVLQQCSNSNPDWSLDISSLLTEKLNILAEILSEDVLTRKGVDFDLIRSRPVRRCDELGIFMLSLMLFFHPTECQLRKFTPHSEVTRWNQNDSKKLEISRIGASH